MPLPHTPRRFWLTTALVLLGVQVAFAAYSFTGRARAVATVDGTEASTLRLGVYEAHWVALRLIGPMAATAEPPFETDHMGLRYMSAKGQCALVEVHFAWTLAANLLVLLLLSRARMPRIQPFGLLAAA